MRTNLATPHFVLWLTIAAVSIWMRTGFPIHAIVASGADDALFLRAAHYLAAGEWLGPYDNLTLAKGMFYPAFILLALMAGVPLKIAEQMVYLAVSGLTARLISRRSQYRWLGTALFTLLAFNPVLWYWPLARIVREGLYISEALAVITLSTLVAFPEPEIPRLPRLVLHGCSLGIVTGAFWLTREEGEWLIPAVGAIALMGSIRVGLVTRTATGYERARRLGRFAVPFAAAAACFSILCVLVASANAWQYGVFEINEFRSASFQRGYGALARIQHDHWQPYVVFPEDARRRAYAVSPAARELAPFLDGPTGEGWRRVGCTQTWAPPGTCPEVLSGWFMWELRDAVALAGHYKSPQEAASFYERLATEIDTACDRGRIPCSPSRATLAPPFRWHYLADLLGPAKTLTSYVLGMAPWPVGSTPSEGPLPGVEAISDSAGPVMPVYRYWHRVIGWAASSTGDPEVMVRPATGQVASVNLSISSGDDVVAAGQGAQAKRFDIETDCPLDKCELLVHVPSTVGLALPWAGLKHGSTAETNDVRVFVESVSTRDVSAGSEARRFIQIAIASAVAHGYARMLPILTATGLLGFLSVPFWWRRRRNQGALIALAAGSLLAVAARIVLLAYLDATSIPAANVLYASPATPLLIVFAVTGTYLGWISLRMLWLAIAFERHGWRGAFIASPWSGREAANAGRADNSARAATRAR